jgi:multidrug efflux pump subunit AcrA (membrane-fusion protein)
MGRTVKKLLLLLLLLAVVVGVVAGLIYLAPAEDKDNVIKFTLMPIEQGTLYKTVGATGTVQPREVVVISTDRPGVVVEIKKDFGDKVREGEELLRLDDRLAASQLEQARKAVDTAEVNVQAAESELAYRQKTEALATFEHEQYKKPGSLYSPEQVRAKELAQLAAGQAVKAAETAVKAARKRAVEANQAVETAKLHLKLTHVYMPHVSRPTSLAADRTPETGTVSFDEMPGRQRREFTIIDRKVSLNQAVGPPAATVLFTVAADPEDVELLAQINEGDIADVKVGQEAIYSVSALPDSYFKGHVTEIRPLPISGQGAVSYLAVIRGPNKPVRDPDPDAKPQPPPGCLRAGMTTASLDVIVDSYKTVTHDGKQFVPRLVPNAALDYSLEKDYWPRGVTKEHKETPKEWKEKYVNGRKKEDAPTPRVIWLCDPQYDSEDIKVQEEVRKKGSETTHPVHVLVGKAGKYWDENRPKLGLQDYTQVLETLNPDALLWDDKGTLYKAVTSDRKPPSKSFFSKISNVIKF